MCASVILREAFSLRKACYRICDFVIKSYVVTAYVASYGTGFHTVAYSGRGGPLAFLRD